mgnify:CR=1 FL=1
MSSQCVLKGEGSLAYTKWLYGKNKRNFEITPNNLIAKTIHINESKYIEERYLLWRYSVIWSVWECYFYFYATSMTDFNRSLHDYFNVNRFKERGGNGSRTEEIRVLELKSMNSSHQQQSYQENTKSNRINKFWLNTWADQE